MPRERRLFQHHDRGSLSPGPSAGIGSLFRSGFALAVLLNNGAGANDAVDSGWEADAEVGS